MNCFCSSYCSQITVALVGKNKFFGQKSFYCCCNCRSTSMSSFLPVNIDDNYTEVPNILPVILRLSADCRSFFLNYFCKYPVSSSMSASRTVRQNIICHKAAFPVNQVFRFDYFLIFLLFQPFLNLL